MEKEFDQYEFEDYLTDEFFNGNEKSEIGVLIKDRLATNDDFKEQYELWLEESSYKSWKEYYQFLEDEEEMAWRGMNPNGDDENE